MTGSSASLDANDQRGMVHETLDYRGLQCPEPILRLSKVARALDEPRLFEVIADDPAFPLDLRSWCKSASATVRSLETIDEEQGSYFKAMVTAGQAAERLPPSSRLRRRSKGPFVALPDAANEEETVELDCMGLRCPEPIMQVARRARDSPPGTTLKVVADDDAFAVDVEAWCRSAGASLKDLSRSPDGQFTAFILLAGDTRRHRQHSTTDPIKAVRSTLVNAATTQEPSSVSFALRDASWDSVRDRLDAVARLGGARVELEGDDSLTPQVLRWCDETGTAVSAFETRSAGAFHASLVVPERRRATHPQSPTPMTASGEQRCALLILNNDHEALLAAMLVASGAQAQGMDVVIFFSFWGLNLLRGDSPRPDEPKPKLRWSQRLFKWLMPAGPRRQRLSHLNFGGAGRGMLDQIMADKNILNLPQLMAAVEDGGARYIACTMSMEVMGIGRRDLAVRPNLEYGGVAAFVEQASGAEINMVF